VIQTWGVSLFDRLTAREPEALAWSFPDLRRILATHHRREAWTDKDAVSLWSPTIYKEGTTRGAANVEAVTALVFDFDDGTPPRAAAAFRDWVHIGHTSWSHTEEAPKWRLILPLEVSVPGEQWPRAWQRAINLWEELKPEGAGMPDLKCKDPSRIYYLPAWRAGQPRRAWAWDDPEAEPHGLSCRLLGLDWERIPEAPTKPTPARRPGRTPETALPGQFKDRARADPAVRERIARQVDATISSDGIARRIACPQCGKRSAWFVVDPAEKKGAECNHRNSCGWHGPVWEL